MYQLKKVIKTVETEHIEKIFCNVCSSDMTVMIYGTLFKKGCHVDFNFGYGSVHDDMWFDIDVCDDCVDKMLDSFKIKPKMKG